LAKLTEPVALVVAGGRRKQCESAPSVAWNDRPSPTRGLPGAGATASADVYGANVSDCAAELVLE